MATHTEHEGFPNIELRPGMVLQLEAINPTTGAAVAGVESTRFMIYAVDESAGPVEDIAPTYSLEVSSDPDAGSV